MLKSFLPYATFARTMKANHLSSLGCARTYLNRLTARSKVLRLISRNSSPITRLPSALLETGAQPAMPIVEVLSGIISAAFIPYGPSRRIEADSSRPHARHLCSSGKFLGTQDISRGLLTLLYLVAPRKSESEKGALHLVAKRPGTTCPVSKILFDISPISKPELFELEDCGHSYSNLHGLIHAV